MTTEERFEIHGYYEEIVIRKGDAWRLIGTRRIPKPENRKLGVEGEIEYVLTAPIELQRGHKTVLHKASPENPTRCVGYAQAICGRVREKAG